MVAGVITTGSSPKALWPGIKAWWGQVYASHPQEWKDLFDEERSTQNYEQIVQEIPFGLAAVKNQGQSVTYDSQFQGYIATFTHIVYGLGYQVTREEIEDNLYPKLARQRTQSLAISMSETRENVHAATYNNAFTNSGPDGVSLLNSAHPNVTGGTFSNILSPAAPLSEAALQDICVLIMQATNDRGLKIALMPQSLHVAPSNYFTASVILKSMFQTNTANNNVNIIATNNMFPKGAFVNHYFTTPNAWFVRTRMPDPLQGLVSFTRRAIEFTKDNDFNTENEMAKSTERYSCGYSDPRCLYGSLGS
jgi:hypothetical protein